MIQGLQQNITFKLQPKKVLICHSDEILLWLKDPKPRGMINSKKMLLIFESSRTNIDTVEGEQLVFYGEESLGTGIPIILNG